NIFPGYDSTIKLLTGLITYPLIYGLQVFLIHQLFNNWKITLVYLVTLLPFGWFALSWQKKYKQFLENKKWKGFNTAGVLKKERKEIMETLTEKILPAQNLIA
ncbi:MAG: hypothetical protein AB8F74_18620, partial [Saprospiraceae bacterium]